MDHSSAIKGSKRSQSSVWEMVAVALLAFILTYINWKYFSHTVQGYDFFMHANIAGTVVQEGSLVTPHFLYHLLLIGVAALFGVNYFMATILIMVASNLAVFLILCWFFSGNKVGLVWGAFWAFLLSFANPLQLVTLIQGGDHYQLYFGYHYLNVFHNPTIVLLKPVALVLFLLISDRRQSSNIGYAIMAAGGAVVCALIKPSFVMCAAPAAFLIWVIQCWRKRTNDTVLLWFWIASIAVLVGQLALYTQFSVTTEQGARSIVFSPLTVLSTWSDHLFLKFLLSVLFVLVVLCCEKSILSDSRFQFASLTFAIACIFTYLFAETGKDANAANFIWCTQISIYMLFVSSMDRFGQNVSSAGLTSTKVLIPLLILLLYLGGGIVWMVQGSMFNMKAYIY